MKKIVYVCAVAALSMSFMATGCSKKEETTTAPAPAPSLYTKLGGYDNIVKVVDTFINNVAADPVAGAQFGSTVDPMGPKDAQGNLIRVRALKVNLIDQICEATGGPCKYSGLTMLQAHKGMNITEAQFSALVTDLSKALDSNGAAAADRDALLGALGMMKADIVGQ